MLSLIAGRSASGWRYSSASWAPVGSLSSSGRIQPVAARSRAAAGSMVNRHGENSRTCPHSRTAAAGRSPASRTVPGRLRSARWAAAARPTGPAPMTATGRCARLGLTNGTSRLGEKQSEDDGAAAFDQDGVAPPVGVGRVAADLFAYADGAEPGSAVQGEAGRVLREDRGLDGPDPRRLGRNDQSVEQGSAD